MKVTDKSLSGEMILFRLTVTVTKEKLLHLLFEHSAKDNTNKSA